MKSFIVLLIINLLLTAPVFARIKLVALPEREATIVRLDNPNATLLEEERTLTLQQGINQVDFSWGGVHIQPDSIRLTILSVVQPVSVLNVSYPPNEQALLWQISSEIGQQIAVRISYLLENIDRLITYNSLINKEETLLDLTSFVILRNFSGENLLNSHFQLDYGKTFNTSIADSETKQIQFFTANQIPIQKRFVFDARELPWDPKQVNDNVGIPTYYELKNTTDSGLGAQTLGEGKMRLSSDDGHQSTIFLGEDNIAVTPIGETVKIKLGESRDIVVTQRKMEETRLNEHYNQRHTQVVLHDKDETMQVEIENFKAQPAAITLIEAMPEEWEMQQNSHDYVKKNAQEIQFDLILPANSKQVVTYRYYQRNIRD